MELILNLPKPEKSIIISNKEIIDQLTQLIFIENNELCFDLINLILGDSKAAVMILNNSSIIESLCITYY